MHIGPFQLEWWHILLGIAALGFLIWFLSGFLVRVTGTWERVDEDATRGAERISLVQFGPFVKGRRKMEGGYQEFTGLLRGRSITMQRRDHGLKMIIGQGFPAPIAHELDGSVTAQMRMTLSADGKVIHGTFSPQKIHFNHNPPEITSRRFLDPSFRRYKLISRQPIDSEEQARPKKTGSDSFRRTV